MTGAKRQEIINRDKKCLKCGSVDELTVDHIIPLSKGGTNIPENLQTLCISCNRRKGNHIWHGWKERILMALHIDEHVTNIRNEWKGALASHRGQIENRLSQVGSFQGKLDSLLDTLKKREEQIVALAGRLKELEDYLKIEYATTEEEVVKEVKEVVIKRGYKKKK